MPLSDREGASFAPHHCCRQRQHMSAHPTWPSRPAPHPFSSFEQRPGEPDVFGPHPLVPPGAVPSRANRPLHNQGLVQVAYSDPGEGLLRPRAACQQQAAEQPLSLTGCRLVVLSVCCAIWSSARLYSCPRCLAVFSHPLPAAGAGSPPFACPIAILSCPPYPPRGHFCPRYPWLLSASFRLPIVPTSPLQPPACTLARPRLPA